MANPERSAGGGAVAIGTRGSSLALAQSNWVKRRLESAWPERTFEIRVIVTSGDRITGSLARVGGKGLFVKEIEEALLSGEVDIAIHSMKDLPIVIPEGLVLAAVPERADPRDVLVGSSGESGDAVGALPANARVGTTSLRRRSQLLAVRPDLRVIGLRGNVDTRLRKRAEGECEAIVVAAAGLIRLSIGADVGVALPPVDFVPAVGQGALALETRAGDDETRRLVDAVNDVQASRRAAAERAFLETLGGDCLTPVGGHAEMRDDRLRLTGLVGTPDGRRIVRGDLDGESSEPSAVGRRLAEMLLARGAGDILEEVRRWVG